jgi:hypothetical protein
MGCLKVHLTCSDGTAGGVVKGKAGPRGAKECGGRGTLTRIGNCPLTGISFESQLGSVHYLQKGLQDILLFEAIMHNTRVQQ